jgi:hypothetical protein
MPSHINYNRSSQTLPMFSGMAKMFAGVIIAGGVATVGYQGIQSHRATLWEGDLASVAKLVDGASAISARELSVLAARDAAAKAALESLAGLEEPMEFLVGKAMPDLASRRQAMAAADKALIQKAKGLSERIAQVLDQRKAGALSSSDFIDSARAALGGDASSVGLAGPFAGPEGFASLNLAAMERELRADKIEALSRLAKAKERLAQLAPDFDEGQSESVAQARAAQAGAEARDVARSNANEQIEGYRKKVRQAATSAFEREGESMGESDWNEINADLERDGDWVSAKAGLMKSAESTAQAARDQAFDNWQVERAHAHEIAAAIALDRSSVDRLQVWEVAMMLQWMDTPQTRSTSIVAIAPQRMAAQGYSLSGMPKAGLDGMSAYKISQSQPAQVAPRYTSSNLSVALAHGLAVRSGDQAAATSLAAKAAAARTALDQATRMASASKNSAYQGPANYAPSAAVSAFAPKVPVWSLGSGVASQRMAMAASSKAAQIAGAQAASKAAQGAAEKVAQGAASKAAQGAADKAAQGAASKAAQGAADKAAQGAASKAAQSAADKAAQSAASKAAQSAANKAAQSAASKAAATASSKAAATASSKAAATASSRSSTSSSSSSRR